MMFYRFQGVLARLEQEKADLQHALAEGHDLLQQSNAPEFLEQTVHDLEERLKVTERLTVEKQKMLIVSEIIRVIAVVYYSLYHIQIIPCF